MSKKEVLLSKLTTLSSYYGELGAYCNEKLLNPFEEKPPEPKVAKWGFQSFSKNDCEKLSQGELELSEYQWKQFPRSKPSKPTIPWLSIVAIVLGILSLVLLIVMLATSAKSSLLIWGISFSAVGALFITFFRRVKKINGLVTFIKKMKKYPQLRDDFERRAGEYIDKQNRNKEQYEADKEYDLANYREEYSKYLNRQEKYYEEQNKIKKELAKKYAAVVVKINACEDIPNKYKDSVDVDFENLENSLNFYDDTVSALKKEIDNFIRIIKNGRADTLKEAINCYLADEAMREQVEAQERHRLKMEHQAKIQQEEQLYAANQQVNAILEAQISELRLKIKSIENDYIQNRISSVEKSQLKSKIESEIFHLQLQKK